MGKYETSGADCFVYKGKQLYYRDDDAIAFCYVDIKDYQWKKVFKVDKKSVYKFLYGECLTHYQLLRYFFGDSGIIFNTLEDEQYNMDFMEKMHGRLWVKHKVIAFWDEDIDIDFLIKIIHDIKTYIHIDIDNDWSIAIYGGGNVMRTRKLNFYLNPLSVEKRIYNFKEFKLFESQNNLKIQNKWYHGSSKDFDNFKTKPGTLFDYNYTSPIFLTSDIEFAKSYAGHYNPIIYTVKVLTDKIFDFRTLPTAYDTIKKEKIPNLNYELGNKLLDFIDNNFNEENDNPDKIYNDIVAGDYDSLEEVWFYKWLKENGFDGAYVIETKSLNLFIFNPKLLKIIKKERNDKTFELYTFTEYKLLESTDNIKLKGKDYHYDKVITRPFMFFKNDTNYIWVGEEEAKHSESPWKSGEYIDGGRLWLNDENNNKLCVLSFYHNPDDKRIKDILTRLSVILDIDFSDWRLDIENRFSDGETRIVPLMYMDAVPDIYMKNEDFLKLLDDKTRQYGYTKNVWHFPENFYDLIKQKQLTEIKKYSEYDNRF